MDAIPDQDSLDEEVREGTPLRDETIQGPHMPMVASHSPRPRRRELRFRCEVPSCGAKRGSLLGLGRHWISTHEPVHRRFGCPECGYKSHHMGSIEQHLREDHQMTDREVKEATAPRTIKVMEGPTRPDKFHDPQGVRAPCDPQWVYEQEGLLLVEEWQEIAVRDIAQDFAIYRQNTDLEREHLRREVTDAKNCQEQLREQNRELSRDHQEYLSHIAHLTARVNTLTAENTSMKERVKATEERATKAEAALRESQREMSRLVVWYEGAPLPRSPQAPEEGPLPRLEAEEEPQPTGATAVAPPAPQGAQPTARAVVRIAPLCLHRHQ